MRGNISTSKQGRTSHKVGATMEINKVDEEEPHLSGAYIRTLVKHLTTPKDQPNHNNGEEPTQHKKQIRRRLHTTRPYQQRLLNMAEARKEIVTALKFHRASMKQQQQKLHLYRSTTTTTATAANCPPPVPYYWHPPPPPPSSSYYDNLNFVLPNQTLGLSLNYQNFGNLEETGDLYHKPVSSGAAAAGEESPAVGEFSGGGGLQLHHAMDDEEMEEIRSLGEQHQIEWNDRINLVTSARWCSFLKTMEIEQEEVEFPAWLVNDNESSCLQQCFDDNFSRTCFQDPALPCMDIGEIEGMDEEWLA